MKQKSFLWHQAAVGMLVIVSIAFVAYYTIIRRVDQFTDYSYKLKISFNNAEGLRKGSKVRILGVDLGRVKELKVMDHIVMVDVSLEKSVPLYKNYHIEIRNESAIGGKYVSIHPGTDTNPIVLKEFNGQLLQGVSYKDPFTSMSELIDENRANVNETIKNIRNITQKVNTGQGTLGKLVNDSEAYNEVNNLVERSENLLGEVREGIEDAREQAPVTSFLRTILTVF